MSKVTQLGSNRAGFQPLPHLTLKSLSATYYYWIKTALKLCSCIYLLNVNAKNSSYLKCPKLKNKIPFCLEDGPELRLVGGSGRCSGRLEVFHRGAWGTVCDDLWDLNEAKVVCRQLGCGRAIAAPGNARFGPGSGDILLDNLQCSGNEGHLGQCPSSSWSDHNCGHHEDASVICSGSLSSHGWIFRPVAS